MVVARHFKSKYLLPVLCLSGLTLYLVNEILTDRSEKKRSRWISHAGILFVVFSLIYTAQGVKKFYRLRSDKLKESIAIGKKLQSEFRDYQIIYYYGASSVIFGLEFGNQWTPAYRTLLREMYGDNYFYNVSNGVIYHWGGKRGVTAEDLNARFNNKYVFFGAPFHRLKQKIKEPGVRLRDVFRGEHLTLYRPVNE